MGFMDDIDDLRSNLGLNEASPNDVEVAATMMPKRMTGIKHMLRPACRFLPMPMSLGWQENPIDDDYPQRLLIQGLQLTDINSGATRTVTAPWMHALYTMTYEEQPCGVVEVKLQEAQFTQSFFWQHLAALCVLAIQAILGFWAFGHHEFREGAFVLLGVSLQIMEGYFAWKFPVYRDPRSVAKARKFVLHKGMTTSHFLVISHQPIHKHSKTDKPYLSLEDAAVPLPILRKGYKRILEATFRTFLQVANLGLKLGCVLSQANGLLIPLTLLIGTVATEIIVMIHTPLPKYSSMETLETAERQPSLLDRVTAVCQRTGCISVGFLESVLPDREGTHTDFKWLNKVLQSETVLAAGVHPNHQTATEVFTTALKRRTQKVSGSTHVGE